jgi:hypothetical protein
MQDSFTLPKRTSFQIIIYIKCKCYFKQLYKVISTKFKNRISNIAIYEYMCGKEQISKCSICTRYVKLTGISR